MLDFSPHSPFNIRTLLEDLKDVPGEVICIFNSHEVFEALADHPRIDKFSYNNLNAGVSRSWNLGLNMAEGQTVFVMNADIHIGRPAVEQMDYYLTTLDQAAMVGPQGGVVDYRELRDIIYYDKGKIESPIKCYSISGFLFAVHRERFQSHGLAFDVRYSPCFFEEWDMGLQIMQAGLACYVVPVIDYDHHWGVSANRGEQKVVYFGRELNRDQILLENREKFKRKWHPLLEKAQHSEQPVRQSKARDLHSREIPDSGWNRLEAFIHKVQNQSYAEKLTQTHSDVTQTMLPQIIDRYTIPREGKILDVGCGQGPALSWLLDHGYQPVGITINSEDLKVCREKGFEVYAMDQSFLDLPDASFDLLWVRHCIEHSIFPFFTLSEFFRVLKPGAVLYLEVPLPDTVCRHETNGNHYSVLTSGMWMSLLERTGFFHITRADITVPIPMGTDTYWAFICRKPPLIGMERIISEGFCEKAA
ncbi:MAG: methyltransferase domain-containing protein [Thermodesulfobacteriota bacterium]